MISGFGGVGPRGWGGGGDGGTPFFGLAIWVSMAPKGMFFQLF